MKWVRTAPLGFFELAHELWQCQSGRKKYSFWVEAQYGKQLSAIRLKKRLIDEFTKALSQTAHRNQKIFLKSRSTNKECPICRALTSCKTDVVEIWGGIYRRCSKCNHFFVPNLPSKSTLEKFYRNEKSYQATYADSKRAALRVREVAMPKLEWTIQRYKKVYGREPRSLLDIGAGSGHFVFAALQRGISANGIEISESGVSFAKEVFNVNLMPIDFISHARNLPAYDLITFWGCIEHVPDPVTMLTCAFQKLEHNKGMVVVEVPRWYSLSTAIQLFLREKSIRHLVPDSHIHVFSEESIATALWITGLVPAAVWYFGLDVFELIMQLTHCHKGNLETFAHYIPYFQNIFDQHTLSDFMAIASVPRR